MTDRAPSGPSAFEREFKEWDVVEFLDPQDNRWKEVTIDKLHRNHGGRIERIRVVFKSSFEPVTEKYYEVRYPFRSIRIPADPDAYDNQHYWLLEGRLQMPKITLPTFKTQSQSFSNEHNPYFIH